jgi:ascorbate PTS system EIIC component
VASEAGYLFRRLVASIGHSEYQKFAKVQTFMKILEILLQFLSKPAILMGMITLVGCLMLKKPAGAVIISTVKTILGLLLLNAGAGIVLTSIQPLNQLLQTGFHISGVLPAGELLLAAAQRDFGQVIAIIFALAILVNVLLARISPWKYIFLSGHHILFMSTLCAAILGGTGLANNPALLVLVCAAVTGFCMTAFPALSAPFVFHITRKREFVMGHFGTSGYVVAGFLGQFIGSPEDSSEKIHFPEWMNFLGEPLVSMGFSTWLLYLAACLASVGAVGEAATAAIFNSSDSWLLSSLLFSLTFAAGTGVVLMGVNMFLAEILPAFRWYAQKVIPNALPALDCPSVFPFAPNAVLLGMLGSLVGQLAALFLQVALAGRIGAVILPSMLLAYFLGGTAGVFGNATGGWKGALVGGLVNGLMFTLLAGTAFAGLRHLGYGSSIFGDADFGLVGNLLTFLSRHFR